MKEHFHFVRVKPRDPLKGQSEGPHLLDPVQYFDRASYPFQFRVELFSIEFREYENVEKRPFRLWEGKEGIPGKAKWPIGPSSIISHKPSITITKGMKAELFIRSEVRDEFRGKVLITDSEGKMRIGTLWKDAILWGPLVDEYDSRRNKGKVSGEVIVVERERIVFHKEFEKIPFAGGEFIQIGGTEIDSLSEDARESVERQLNWSIGKFRSENEKNKATEDKPALGKLDRAEEDTEKDFSRGFLPSRRFNSELELSVWAMLTDAGEDGDIWAPEVMRAEEIGSTPSEEPLAIPESLFWMAAAKDTADELDWESFESLIRDENIPGINMPEGTSDDHMAMLSGLENLRALDLSRTDVTDEGLGRLKELPRLRMLDLRETDLTDEGLKHLKRLANLKMLYLTRTNITNEGLRHLADLKNLQALDLWDTEVSDDGMKYLTELGNLWVLVLRNNNITDEGMGYVGKLEGLRALNLIDTAVTDEGLACLAGLDELRDISLWGTKITGSGFRHFKNFRDLHEIELRSTPITDVGLQHLAAAMPNLRHLRLENTEITDDGLWYLRGLENLSRLDLSRTGITDEGLRHLHGHENLGCVMLRQTDVTEKGAAELDESLPRGHVHHFPKR